MDNSMNIIYESAIKHGLINSYSDLEIATERGFQKRACEASKLFEGHYTHLETLSNEELMRILRYFMCKAAESCIADELYSSDKDRTCNVTYLLNEVDDHHYTINIPAHYIWELDDLSLYYLMPIKEIIDIAKESNRFDSIYNYIVDWQLIAYAHAHIKGAYKAHIRYDNKLIRTLDETRIIALRGIMDVMTNNGWKVEKMNYLLSNPWSIIGKHNEKDFAILLRTNYGYRKANLSEMELDKLATFAQGANYSLGYMMVDINSVDQQHEKDKVIIIGDQINFKITAFKLFDRHNSNDEGSV